MKAAVIPEEDWLGVSDLRQFLFCQRVFFFKKTLSTGAPVTLPMDQGRTGHDRFEKLEQRRSSLRYGLHDAIRHRKHLLASGALGLTGVADLILEDPDECVIVEFKTGKSGWRGHRLQLAAYALLAQEEFQKPCRRGILVYESEDNQEEVMMDKYLLQEVYHTLGRMRQTLMDGVLPEPVDIRGRCKECEFKAFCGDVYE